MSRWSGLTRKVTLVFVIFAAGILLGLGLLAYLAGRTTLETAVLSDLQTTALEKEAAFGEWLTHALRDITSFASLPGLGQDVMALHQSDADVEDRQAHDDVLAVLHSVVETNPSFQALFILHPTSGRILVASNLTEEGKFRENQRYFVFGRERPYLQTVYYSLQLQRPSIAAAAPIRVTDGDLAGVLVGRLNLEEMAAIMARRTGLRRTVDAYLINPSQLFVTQPRALADPAILRFGNRTDAAKSCLAGNSGYDVGPNYQQVDMLSVYRWLPDYSLCLIVEMEQAEAFEPVHMFGIRLVLLGILILFLAVAVAAGLARTITRPVRALQAGAAQLAQGNLDIQLPDTSHDEIGALARTFNQMALSLATQARQLRMYTAELEEKVQEHTAALQASEAELRTLFSAMTDVVFVLDTSGRYVRYGPTNPVGIPRPTDELVGKYLTDLFPENQAQQFLECIRDVLSTSRPQKVEYPMIIEGQRLWFAAHVSALSPSTVLWVARDITERKQAEERDRMLFDYTAELSSAVTPDDVVLAAANRISRMLMAHRVAIGLLTDESTKVNQVTFTADGVEPILEGTTEHGESSWPITDVIRAGQPIWLETSQDIRRRYSADSPGSVEAKSVRSLACLPLVMQGITVGALEIDFQKEQHFTKGMRDFMLALALQCSQALERARLYKAETEARQAAEEANQLKLQFLGMISHELRTPLTSIKGFATTLLAEDVEFDAKTQTEFVSIMDQEADKLTDLVEQLIDVSRIQAGNLRVHAAPERLADILNFSQPQLLKLTSQHRLQVDVPAQLPPVMADKQRIGQVLVNLVENAVKFSDPGTNICIAARSIGDTVQIEVRDEGEGIPLHERETIFEPFRQLDRRQTQRGAGLGLAICRALVEAHGGVIWVEDGDAPGTTIAFTLSVAPR
jgi:PAS domain S-box-containing protein